VTAVLHIAIVEDDPKYQRELQTAVERYARKHKELIRTSIFSDGDGIL